MGNCLLCRTEIPNGVEGHSTFMDCWNALGGNPSELDRLLVRVAHLESDCDEYRTMYERMHQERCEAQQRIAALEAWIREHGRHSGLCMAYDCRNDRPCGRHPWACTGDLGCTCGLETLMYYDRGRPRDDA